MKIFSGTSNEAFAGACATELQLSLGKREIVSFSDGETRVRIEEDVKGEIVLLLQTFALHPNQYLIETFLLLDTLKSHEAATIVGIFPYLAYARQNKQHRPGEGISLATVARLLQTVGLKKLITYDTHAEDALSFFTIPTYNVPILPIILERLINEFGEEKKEMLVVVAPDQDGAKRGKAAASAVGLPHAFVEKERNLEKIDVLKEIHGDKVIGDVAGKIVVLVDDMITTGATLIQAAKYVKEAGAIEVYACATHGIFTKGFEIVTSSDIQKIYISDSIAHPDLPPEITVVPTVSQVVKIVSNLTTAVIS